MSRPDTPLDQLLAAGLRLREACDALRFAEPVTHVYNPLHYAWNVHEAYLNRFGQGPKRALWLGMNPGPWGMAQTGVPFGEVAMARDWLKLPAPSGRPENEHPKRPVLGHACTRAEVSGARLWGAVQHWFGSPEAFFAEHLIFNHTPLLLLEASGKNHTPEQLPKAERQALEAAGDAHLAAAVALLEPEFLIGVGRFAEARCRAVAQGQRVLLIAHPSPASPAANRGWTQLVEPVLAAEGLLPGQG